MCRMRDSIRVGDCLEVLPTLPARSVQCCLTSPPYWGLRDYGGGEDQLGHEFTVQEYVARLVEVFRAVRRVLSDDGVAWLNLGDCYSSGLKGSGGITPLQQNNPQSFFSPRAFALAVPAKNLVGVPWRVAFALQADGWILRNDVIWMKRNAMCESVTDRLTRSYEHVFLLAKRSRYRFHAAALGTPIKKSTRMRKSNGHYAPPGAPIGAHSGINGNCVYRRSWANGRDVWDVPRDHWRSREIKACVNHAAMFPPALAERCILAGSREGDVVLDPFTGTGTAGEVALRLQRRFVGVELSQEYAELARARCRAVRQKNSPRSGSFAGCNP